MSRSLNGKSMAENHTVNCDASRGGRGKSLLEREGGESVYTRQQSRLNYGRVSWS